MAAFTLTALHPSLGAAVTGIDLAAPIAVGLVPPQAALLARLKGIGPEFASILCLELLFRSFVNRREVASYAGLTPSPFKSGGIDREQGIAKSGNPRLRRAMSSWPGSGCAISRARR